MLSLCGVNIWAASVLFRLDVGGREKALKDGFEPKSLPHESRENTIYRALTGID